MLLEILKRTPAWVFVLFVVLMALGCFYRKPRVIARRKVAILPLAMILLSLYGVLSAFGVSVIGIVVWLVGVEFAVLLNHVFPAAQGVKYSAASQSLSIPGSWMPLALMMAIYFTRYGVAVALARKSVPADLPVFIASVSFIYGFLSGLFFARALVMWRIAKERDAPPA